MTGQELNILIKIKERSVEEQRDYLLEQNMLLAGKIATLEKENAEAIKELLEIINRIISWAEAVRPREYLHDIIIDAKKLINKDEGK